MKLPRFSYFSALVTCIQLLWKAVVLACQLLRWVLPIAVRILCGLSFTLLVILAHVFDIHSAIQPSKTSIPSTEREPCGAGESRTGSAASVREFGFEIQTSKTVEREMAMKGDIGAIPITRDIIDVTNIPISVVNRGRLRTVSPRDEIRSRTSSKGSSNLAKEGSSGSSSAPPVLNAAARPFRPMMSPIPKPVFPQWIINGIMSNAPLGAGHSVTYIPAPGGAIGPPPSEAEKLPPIGPIFHPLQTPQLLFHQRQRQQVT